MKAEQLMVYFNYMLVVNIRLVTSPHLQVWNKTHLVHIPWQHQRHLDQALVEIHFLWFWFSGDPASYLMPLHHNHLKNIKLIQ